MVRSAISGISFSNSRRTKSGCVLDRMILTRCPTLRTSKMTALMRSPTWWVSPGDNARPAFVPGNGAVHEVSLHGRVLIEDGVTLGFPNLLDHHLLGAL